MDTHFNSLKQWDGNPKTLHYDQFTDTYCVKPEDKPGEPITFKWHFQRGILSKRMSGYEIATVILREMGAIIGQGLLSDHPKIEQTFTNMFTIFATTPQKVLDELLPWTNIEWHQGDFDILHLSFDELIEPKKGKIYKV